MTPGDARLPAPDAIGREHSERLTALVRARVAAGPISFADYMAQALYEPGLGYYMAGAPKFGAGGDFITAPELSPLFGQCVAAQCLEVLTALDESASDAPPGILELGAGNGLLAASILGALAPARPVPYFILEPSAELRERQRALLAESLAPEVSARVRWLDRLPADFAGVVLANEVMDALPVERFARQDGQLWQVAVTDDEGAFRDVLRAPPPAVEAAVQAIESDLGHAFGDDYASEFCPGLAPWIEALGESLATGVILLADYGYPRREYYLAERDRGTLTCHYRHHAHGDPYFLPGLQDITAHVDFTRVAEAGVAAGLSLLGYTTQSAFLLGCDLQGRVEAAHAALTSEAERFAQARAVRTLTLPGEMGERFQFIALGKGYDRPLRGFVLQDLAHRL